MTDFLIRKNKTTKEHILFWTALILFLLLGISIAVNVMKSREVNEKNNLIEALNDTIKVSRDELGRSVGRISVINTQKPKDFINVPSNNPEIVELQQLVKKYEKQIKNGGSATIFTSETKYDTVYKSSPSVLAGRTLDSINNGWIKSRFGFVNDSTIYSLRVKNKYSVVIGEESQGLFKPKKPFVEVISENPYDEIKKVRTYQVTPLKKKLIIKPGIYGGYGGTLIDGVVKTGPQIGGGIILTF